MSQVVLSSSIVQLLVAICICNYAGKKRGSYIVRGAELRTTLRFLQQTCLAVAVRQTPQRATNLKILSCFYWPRFSVLGFAIARENMIP